MKTHEVCEAAAGLTYAGTLSECGLRSSVFTPSVPTPERDLADRGAYSSTFTTTAVIYPGMVSSA